jgi:RAQPRD family integrative conjugative element protein
MNIQRMKRMMRKIILAGLLIGFPLLLVAEPNPAMESDRENVALARIYTLLNQLTPFIQEAQRYQNKQTRVQFRYESLQQDIEQIKYGIDAKFHPPSIEPRVISSIQGDYLTFKRQSK